MFKSSGHDILITGLPRGGTTLAAAQLDAQDDTVCLNEPAWQHPSPKLDARQFAQAIAKDFDRVRADLFAGREVPDRRDRQGKALTNYYELEDGVMREKFVMHRLTRPNLSRGFTLGMKHNGPYLAVLPELIDLKRFEIRAVIRNPLHVIRSWRRLSLPVSRGELPTASRYWKEMRELTEARLPLLDTQVLMVELMFKRIQRYEPYLKLMRYEEMAGEHGEQASAEKTPEDRLIIRTIQQYAPVTGYFYPSLG